MLTITFFFLPGFILDSTKLLRKTFYSAQKKTTVALEEGKISVSLKSAVRQIRFSAEETQLLVATEGGKLLVYTVDDINNNVNIYIDLF